MTRPAEHLDDRPMGPARRRGRAPLAATGRGLTRRLALAGLLAGSLLLSTPAAAAPPERRPVHPAPPAAAASTARSAPAAPPHLSPYFVAARQHAQATSGTAHAPSVPPSMRRTRQPIGQQSSP
jgi:hypothetical protein